MAQSESYTGACVDMPSAMLDPDIYDADLPDKKAVLANRRRTASSNRKAYQHCFFAGSIVACVAAVALHWLETWFPLPYADRLDVIPEAVTQIDNVQPYDSVDKWAADGSQAGLHLLNPARVSHFDQTIRHILQPPFHVLDAGCGGGLVSNALAMLDGYVDIHGVDLSAEALLYATAEASRKNLTHVSYQQASVYELPFESSSFDVVIMSDVLEHFLDVVGALKEAARVLKPNGIFLFDTINRSPLAFLVSIIGAEYVVRIVSKGSHDWRLFIKPEELQRALALAGFHEGAHDAFEPSFRALMDLSLFSFGFLSAGSMQGGWTIEPPSSTMISYIGHAVRAPSGWAIQ